VTFAENGDCAGATIALLGVGEGPILAERAGAMLAGASVIGGALDGGAIEAAAKAAAEGLEPSADIHASAEFRRHLVRVLVERSLRAADAGARM
jgi:CO/xanthine dehydrogenase FAD-binding subunit